MLECRRRRRPLRTVSQPEAPAPKPLRILVAEDDPCDALLLEQALFKAEVHVPIHFVDDGEEAVAYLRGDPPFANRSSHQLPTLLLMSLGMPRMSGFDVLHWLRLQPELGAMLVVLCGSSRKPADIENAYALGADAYLVKPADAADLVEAANWLKRYWLDCWGQPRS